MRIRAIITAFALAAPLTALTVPVLGDGRVGEIVRAEERSQVEGEGQAPESLLFGHGEQARDFFLDERVTAQPPPDRESVEGYLQMHLEDDRNTLAILRDGSMKITRGADGLICDVSGKVLLSGKRVRNASPDTNCDVLAGGFFFRHLSTEFLIDARGIETSLFVIEGSVEVFSEDPAVTERQVVLAGEWLVTRKGEPIPEPKRYRRTDVISGSSECIYSWCRLTRSIDNEPPDHMRVLIPPPPNPPGRQ